jgi:two-component system, NtrC family, response regulator AtoC
MIINVRPQTDQEVSGFVLGPSLAMQTLEKIARDIAPTNIPVLLFGEVGTGKQEFARRLHKLSERSKQRFRTIACASLSSATFQAELEMGTDSEGRREPKNNALGTVFFDEISELDPTCQRNLLYALPDNDVVPGPGQLTDRVISATTGNLEEDMRAGHFRIELYFRINAVSLRLPPLRERKEDIPPLVEFFLRKHCAQLGKPQRLLSPHTMQKFLDHSWPGNIRELENSVKRVVVLGEDQLAVAGSSTGTIETQATHPEETHVHSLKAAARTASREAERDLILEAMARTRWNRRRAAQELQISYKSLLYKLKRIGVEVSKLN